MFCRKDQSYDGLGCPFLRLPLPAVGMAGGGPPPHPLQTWLITWRRLPGEDEMSLLIWVAKRSLSLCVPSHPCNGRKEHWLLSVSFLQQDEGSGNPAPQAQSNTAQTYSLLSQTVLVLPLISSVILDKSLNLSGLQFSDQSTQINGVKYTHSEKLFKIGFVLGTTYGILFCFVLFFCIDQKELIQSRGCNVQHEKYSQ